MRLRGIAGELDAALTAVPGRPSPLPANYWPPWPMSPLWTRRVSRDRRAPPTGRRPRTGPGDLDVLVAVTGATADLPTLAAVAGRAQLGAVLVVDPQPGAAAVGPVVVLRGPTAEHLLADWDRTVGGR